MSYTLLPASDASAFAVDIAAELLSKQWGGSLAARKAQLLQKNFSWLLVDSIDPTNVVGHVKLTSGVQTSSDMYGTAPTGVLTSVVINEAHRGKGIGTLLMRAIEEQALIQGYCTLILWTPDAMNFYSKLGYIPCESRRALTTLVTSIESISAKSISKLEQLFAKRTANNVESEQLDNASTGSHDTNNSDSQQMVWMQKRIRDEMPLQDVPLTTLVQSIKKSLAIMLPCGSAEGAVIYLNCSDSSTTADASSSTDLSASTTDNNTLTLPWAQQVGPSCGIQAIRFAERILNSANHRSHIVRYTLNNTHVLNDEVGSTEVSNECNGASKSSFSVADIPVSGCGGSLSVLALAIERQYTEQGALYHIHHLVDLLLRNQDTRLSANSFQPIDAYVASAQAFTAGQFCNLLLGHPPVLNTVESFSATSTIKRSTTRSPMCVILPYDRDSTYSTPCCKEGVAAHYALVCGFIILPEVTAVQSESHICSSGILSLIYTHVLQKCPPFYVKHCMLILFLLADSGGSVDESIDPERVHLVAMHGLTWQPIVASYTDFMTSNAQLHCVDEKLVFNNHVPNLMGNMVVVRSAE